MCVRRFEEALLDRGHEVQLVRPRQRLRPPWLERPRRTEILVRGIPVPMHGGLQLGLPAPRALERRWRRVPPDLVHIASEWLLGHAALRAAQRLELPVTTSFHTNFHEYGAHYGLGWLGRAMLAHLRRFHGHGERTLVPTPQLRDRLAGQGFERLVVVPRGVDTRLYRPAHRSRALRRRWGADAETLVTLYVGRLAPEKNVPLAVEAFRQMQRIEPGARMVLVGDGPERTRLGRENPDLIFAGLLRGEELARHYASADVFLFPSLTETFGNVVLEAMASGLAVVAFDEAAARQHVRNGENGIVARGTGTEPFIEAARQLARERGQIARLGARAAASARTIGWDHVGDVLEDVLVKAASAPRRAPATVPVTPSRLAAKAGSVSGH
jgi:glycosyltransferase involved in cell wall biosynthesis